MATWQRICRVRILQMSRVLADAFLARLVLMLWLARLADIRQAVLRQLARLDDIRRAVLSELASFADTRQTRRHLPDSPRLFYAYKICYLCLKRPILSCALAPSLVARTCQTRRHSPKAIFEKNVTRLDKFARVAIS